MDIRVTSTGKVFYQIDSAIAAVLVEAFPASFECANKPATPLPPARARWSISQGLDGSTFIRVVCDTCRKNTCYAGRVYDISEFDKTLCVHAGPCPAEIREQYASSFTGNLSALPWS
jgi:uncharacterized protein CbrC (UPF0167 family)